MMMASIVTLPVLVFTMCLALLPIALLVVLQVFLCRKSRKLGLIPCCPWCCPLCSPAWP